MRTLPSPGFDAAECALSARIDAVVAGLFRRWPALLGFSLQDAADELRLADLELQPWTARPEDALGDVALALAELLEENPAALEALRGRTFARTLH